MVESFVASRNSALDGPLAGLGLPVAGLWNAADPSGLVPIALHGDGVHGSRKCLPATYSPGTL